MAVGSAFDAYIKSYLHHIIFQNYGAGDKFRFENLFEQQVESQNRDVARGDGQKLFEGYLACGATNDVLTELQKAIGEPKFEVILEGRIGKELGGVPVQGRPDLFFRNHEACPVVFDWKVNGFYSRTSVSPMSGYIKVRDAYGDCRGRMGMHKDCIPNMYRGIMINIAKYLEDCNEDWALQTSIYGWLEGETIGSEIVCWIDQLACGPGTLRVATHRMRVSEKFQYKAIDMYQKAWARIQEQYIFDDMSKEDSQRLQETMDKVGLNYVNVDFGSKEDWFNQVTR
jgi:hypothetical protein